MVEGQRPNMNKKWTNKGLEESSGNGWTTTTFGSSIVKRNWIYVCFRIFVALVLIALTIRDSRMMLERLDEDCFASSDLILRFDSQIMFQKYSYCFVVLSLSSVVRWKQPNSCEKTDK